MYDDVFMAMHERLVFACFWGRQMPGVLGADVDYKQKELTHSLR